jgi:glutamate carboxypeptidase
VDLTTLPAVMTQRLPQILADIEELVRCESPSADLAAVAASADMVARIGARLAGAAPERIVIDGRTHLRWRLGGAARDEEAPPGEGPPRVLLLAHHDTVWPIGSLATHPFSVDDGVLRGPGCFDMKTGLVLALHAVAVLLASPQAPLRAPGGGCAEVTILVTGDEEVGSLTSRELIEAEASGCRAALVLEASADGGAIKTARKGTSMYRVRALGRAAHAGLEPERGINATVELARQVLAVAGIADARRGTTVTPTVLAAGRTLNTVPDEGTFEVDVRAWDDAEQARVDTAMRALAPVTPGARLEVTGGPNRPALPESASAALFERARALAAGLGLPPLEQAAVGGASDGNLTAGAGTPTLDGLGAVGGGAHADNEHVLVAELPGRAALLAALINDLLLPPGETPPGGSVRTPRNGEAA